MLRSYLPVVWRTLKRHRQATILNITCLVLGLTISMLLGSYCINEYSYDLFHTKANRIYQLWATVQMGTNEDETDRFSIASGEELLLKYPKIESVARFARAGKASIQYGEGTKSEEQAIIFTDAHFFEVFTFPLSKGTSALLDKPNSVLISEEVSKKYFGDEIPVGKTLRYNDTLMLHVDGVLERIPSQSSLQFDFVISFSTLKNFPQFSKEFSEPHFGLGSTRTFLLMKEGQSAKELSDLIPIQEVPFKINGYHLESLNGAHVRNYGNEENKAIPIFLTISIVLFVVVIINSINITSAQNIERTKEIIIRKINGAKRIHIISLFYVEAFIISFISLGLAFCLGYLLSGLIEKTLAISIEWKYLSNISFLYFIGVAFIFMVLSGGIYPLLVLSTIQPVLSLTSSHEHGGFSKYARRFSVVFQFTVSSLLVIGVLLIKEQLSFIEKKDLGMDLENVFVLKLDQSESRQYLNVKRKVEMIPGVIKAGASNISLFQDQPPIMMASRQDSSAFIELSMLISDKDFFEVMKIKPLAGEINNSGILLNETAAKSFFGQADGVGSQILMANRPMNVSAVIKDYNYSSLRENISHLSMSIADDSAKVFGFTGSYLYIRKEPILPVEQFSIAIGKVLKEEFSGKTFEPISVKGNFDKDYIKERQLLESMSLFTIVAIAIAGLGLCGQLMFQILNMLPQLSIRKVLGASQVSLFFTLFKEIIILIVLSVIIAVPATLLLMSKWMEAFTYKTSFSFASIITGVIVILSIALLITLTFMLQVQRNNPIKFLRKE